MAKKFTVILSDGTALKNLELTGNTFVSSKKITSEDFSGKLKHVIISCDDENFRDKFNLVGEHDNMLLANCCKGSKIDEYNDFTGKYLFTLYNLSESEMRDMRINARLDYLEMLGDVV